MGNINSNVESSVKQQGDNKAYKLYNYVNIVEGSILVDLMKECIRDKKFEKIDEAIRRHIKPFLYNRGEGKSVPVADLVKVRARGEVRSSSRRSSSITHNSVYPMLDVIEADEQGSYVGPSGNQHDSQMREVCWDINQRGSVGETCLHICFLAGTYVHYELAKRMIAIFPKMINDYYLSDEYYGENVLHMAISNEDPAMCKYLMDQGVDLSRRCFGNFFTPEDQKGTRIHSLEYEWVEMRSETNYEGHVYWGEYPLSFAACCGQEECLRLLIAKGADPNLQDTNGNTVLHIIVIHEPKMKKNQAMEFFDILVNKGARLDIKNYLRLTPLTLAAKLARKEMFQHILKLDQEINWRYANVTSIAHPLSDLDTISIDGRINKDSALMHITFGEKREHLEMMQTVISQILEMKWTAYVRKRFYTCFFLFIIYFIFFTTAFYLRPGRDKFGVTNISDDNRNVTLCDPCYLMTVNSSIDVVRFISETVVLLGAVTFLILNCREMYFQGIEIYLITLSSAPMKVLFLFSCTLIILMLPGRALCVPAYEDVVGISAILSTAPYFLFFCRGFKMVGPFVVMIYKMVRGDLLRFFTIYAIFLFGFSQSMFIIFRRVDKSIFHDPAEALVGMFIMSLGEFSEIYEQFDCSAHKFLGKLLFVVYMILVTLLLVNMLIAMMGNTYDMVSETQMEWLRQWAKIVLVMEQTFSTTELCKLQRLYSEELDDGRLALVISRHDSYNSSDVSWMNSTNHLSHYLNNNKTSTSRRQKSGKETVSTNC